MDDARKDIGRRIVEAARMAVGLHLHQEAQAQSPARILPLSQLQIANWRLQIPHGGCK
jgi:hypothetical protein